MQNNNISDGKISLLAAFRPTQRPSRSAEGVETAAKRPGDFRSTRKVIAAAHMCVGAAGRPRQRREEGRKKSCEKDESEDGS